jgi:hypothetical protein
MDIHKLAAWANVGSFAIGCVALYLVWPSQRPPTPENGAAAQPVTSFHSSMWIFLLVLFLAGLLHLVAAVVQRNRDHVPVPSAPQTRNLAPSPNPVGNVPPPSTPPPSGFDAQTTLPDGRVINSCSLEYLARTHRENTLDQFNRLLGGKWIKISGKIDDNHGNGLVYLMHSSPLIRLQFAKGWEQQLSLLGRGSTVIVRGKVSAASGAAIVLGECELL